MVLLCKAIPCHQIWAAQALKSTHLQAKHVRQLFAAADIALQQLQPASAGATVAAAEALRQVLEALEQLSCSPSEAALKQLIALLRANAPDLQQACWLLVSQQDTFKTQVSGMSAKHARSSKLVSKSTSV